MNSIITWPMVLVLVGAIMVACGGFWANMNANKEKIKNLEIQVEFEQNLNQKNEEIIQLNKELTQYTIGGDNYPIITESIDHTTSTCHFSIFNFVGEKKLPLYDVYALIIDLDEQKSIEKNNELTLPQKMRLSEEKAVMRVNVGYLSGVGGVRHLLSIKCPPQNQTRNFEFTMTARNTEVKQKSTIYYDRENQQYHVKSKAEKNSEVLFNSY